MSATGTRIRTKATTKRSTGNRTGMPPNVIANHRYPGPADSRSRVATTAATAIPSSIAA